MSPYTFRISLYIFRFQVLDTGPVYESTFDHEKKKLCSLSHQRVGLLTGQGTAFLDLASRLPVPLLHLIPWAAHLTAFWLSGLHIKCGMQHVSSSLSTRTRRNVWRCT